MFLVSCIPVMKIILLLRLQSIKKHMLNYQLNKRNKLNYIDKCKFTEKKILIKCRHSYLQLYLITR